MSNALELQWQEASVKHVNNLRLLRSVRAKQVRARRDAAARRAESEELGRQQGACYRAAGRAFVRAEKEVLLREAAEGEKEAAAALETGEKQAQFLAAKVRENEQQMGELMRSGRQ